MKNRILKVNNNLLESEKDFKEFRYRKSKDREVKLRSEIEVLFFKPIIVLIDNMDRFEEKEIIKKRAIVKNPRFEGSINYISEPIKNGECC